MSMFVTLFNLKKFLLIKLILNDNLNSNFDVCERCRVVRNIFKIWVAKKRFVEFLEVKCKQTNKEIYKTRQMSCVCALFSKVCS